MSSAASPRVVPSGAPPAGENLTEGEQTGRLFDEIVKAISLALDFDESVKLNHAWRVGLLAHRIAGALGLADQAALFYAGFLHDIGAVGLRDHVIHHARAGFSDREALDHPTRGARIVRPFSLLRPMETIIANHHERIDGRGFPAGHQGDEIPVGASILRFADLVDVVLGPLAPEARRQQYVALAQRESGTGCPVGVVEAAVGLLDSHDDLLHVLFDDAALERAVRETRPQLPGLARLTRTQLLGQMLWVFARIVDAKHSYTMGHSTRVAFFAHRIAQDLGEGAADPWDVLWAALLHDVGKVGVPRRLLDKPGALTAEELTTVQQHASDSRAIISSISALAHLAYPAAAHHERYDGRGYPDGRAAEQVPLIGRTLAYADVYDALTSERSYRHGLSHEDALGVMKRLVGSQFDPHLAEAAFETLDRRGVDALELGSDLQSFLEFFHAESPDLSLVASVGQRRERVSRSVGKGVLLVELEPWRAVRLSPTLDVLEGLEELSALTGERAARFLDHLESDARAELAERLDRLETAPATQYVYTPQGAPLEAIFLREDGAFRVLLRSAGNRLQTMKRMSLFYRNFLSSSEAVAFTDPQTTIVDVNRTLLDLTGYQLKELIGRPVELLRGASTDELFAEVQASIRDAAVGAWSGELTLRGKDGSEVPVLLVASAVRDSAGSAAGFIFRASDITERKQAEEELRRRDRELSEKNRTLERLDRMKSDLVAITSHDLRSPLGSIVGLARLARERVGAGDPLADALERITDSALSLTHFVNDLLDSEAIEAGGIRLNPRPLRIGAVLEAAVAGLPERAVTGVTVTLERAGLDRLTLADPARIDQVFVNLLTNAVKFSPPGSEVEVTLADEGGPSLRVTVADRGPGIPPQDVDAIFDRYFQVERKGAVPKRGFGVGLGLTIVKSLVHGHGGSVHAENREGGGCRFVVELPVRPPEGAATRPLALLVDPEEQLGPALTALLEQAGMRWAVARDHVEARRTLAFEEPVAVFVDRGAIPEDLAGALAQHLYADGGRPFVVDVWPAEVAPGLERGAGTLTLPALDVEVLELVRAALAEARRGRS